MTTLTDLLADVQITKLTLDEAVTLVLKQVQNTEGQSLEERWKAFVAIHELLPTEIYGDGYVEDLNGSWTLYDTFYMERYATHDYPDFYYRAKEQDDAPSQEVFDMWRERVLAGGHGGFTYDW